MTIDPRTVNVIVFENGDRLTMDDMGELLYILVNKKSPVTDRLYAFHYLTEIYKTINPEGFPTQTPISDLTAHLAENY